MGHAALHFFAHSTCNGWPQAHVKMLCANFSRLKSLRSPHLANGRSRYGGIGNSDDRLSTKLSTSSTSASTAIGLRSYSPVNDAASEAANGRLTRCGCLASETHQALMHSEGRRQMLLQKLKDTQDFIKVSVEGSVNAKFIREILFEYGDGGMARRRVPGSAVGELISQIVLLQVKVATDDELLYLSVSTSVSDVTILSLRKR